MARGFTVQEKENIRKHLLEVCKQCWTKYGYKKTGVDELCSQAGISKGAFYLFFESKEALFCEVLCSVQEQIYEGALRLMEEENNKRGVAKALKFIYREYDRNNFLYDSDSRDFTVLMNKLSKEQTEKLQESAHRNRQLFRNRPGLKFRVDEELAMSVIYSLIMNIRNREVLPYDHKRTFDFMADCLTDSLYEQEG